MNKTQKFIIKANHIHNDQYTYDRSVYAGVHTKVIITCPIHGDFEQRPGSHLQGRGCWPCRMDVRKRSQDCVSSDEQMLADFLSQYTNVTQATDDIVKPHVLDITLPEHNIAIEYATTSHYGELSGKYKQYYKTKQSAVQRKGYDLIYIRDSEWINKRDIVKSRLLSKIQQSQTVYARRCSIVDVTDKQKLFFDQNHIQGGVGSKVAYGLLYDDQIVAVMSFGIGRFAKHKPWELLRYANVINTTVVGGASRLFKHFVKIHNPTEIVTYSDKRWNTGQLYTILGFTYVHTSLPNYHYFHLSNHHRLFSRVKFQKHKLHKLLTKFDPKMTEYQNMVANGYDRMWDCGNDVFVWKP